MNDFEKDLIELIDKHYKLTLDYANQTERNIALKEALQEISKGEGAYDMEPYKHCQNCLESMKSIAIEALK